RPGATGPAVPRATAAASVAPHVCTFDATDVFRGPAFTLAEATTRKHYSQLPEKPHGCVEARVGGDTGRSRCGAERVSVVTCQGVDGNSHADHQRRVPGRITTVGVDVHRVGVAYPEPLAGADRDGALLVADHVLLVEKPPGDLPVRETLHLDVEFVADRVEQSFAYGRHRRAVPFHPHLVTNLEHLLADHHEQFAPGVLEFEG